jgi:hypothetical protein
VSLGISPSTLKRAPEQLDVASVKADFGGGWRWSLPAARLEARRRSDSHQPRGPRRLDAGLVEILRDKHPGTTWVPVADAATREGQPSTAVPDQPAAMAA